MINKNHSLYENFTKLYELVFKPFFISGIRTGLEALKLQKPKSALEVGCGPGYSFELYPAGVHLTAYDLSEKMAKEAKKRAQEILENEIRVFGPEEYHAQTTGQSYDAVLSFSVITVVPDPQAFLEHLRIRCKKGGHIYLVMHNRSKGLGLVFDYIFEWPCRLFFGFTLLRNIHDLDIGGLEIVKEKRVNRFLLWSFSSLIVLKKNF